MIDVAARLESLGPWAPLVFVGLYIVASVALVPGAALTLFAGAAFGVAAGVPLVFTGAVLGSSAAFGIARTLARERVARWLARDARAAAIDAAVRQQGWRVVLLLRLSPVFPYGLLNYALGASGVSYRDFLVGSIGMLPATVVYTYYGQAARDALALVAGAPPRGRAYYVLLAGGLAATVLLMVLITRAARRALEQPRDR